LIDLDLEDLLARATPLLFEILSADYLGINEV